MNAVRWGPLLALLFLLTGAAAAKAADLEEVRATFVRVVDGKLRVTLDDGKAKDMPFAGDVEFFRKGQQCKVGDLQKNDVLTLTIELPEKGKALPPRLIRVVAR
jgi:hypothetical protein